MYTSIQEATKVATIDAAIAASGDSVSKYAEDNSFLYHSALNYWLAQLDVLGCDYKMVRDVVKSKGLLYAIKSACLYADLLIKGDCTPETATDFGLWSYIVSDLSFADALQVLRFLKRLSPQDATVAAETTANAFLTLNQKLKRDQRQEKPRWLILAVKEVISDVLSGFNYEMVEDHPNTPCTTGYFSTGASAYMSKCKADKISHWSHPYYLSNWYPMESRDQVPLEPISHRGYFDPRSNHSINNNVVKNYYTAECQLVPKSYKSARLIAKEHPTRQWYMQAVRAELENTIARNGYSKYLDFHDQETNRFQAYASSCDGTMATVDLSSASDSISVSLVRDVFPARLVKLIDKYRSYTFELNGKVHITQMAFTSGSALTFPIETILFYSIAKVATEFCGVDSPAYAYGDDTLVHTSVYETYCDFLAMLGFTVNMDKSFSTGAYRESCGVEYDDGIDCHTTYFPRKPLKRDLGSVESIRMVHNSLYIALQSPEILHVTIDLLRLCGLTEYTMSTIDQYYEGDIVDIIGPFEKTITISRPRYGEIILTPEGKKLKSTKVDVEAHCFIDERPHKLFKLDDQARQCYEMLLYVDYLLHGPMYESSLDALLGCSVSRRSKGDITMSAKAVIGYQF